MNPAPQKIFILKQENSHEVQQTNINSILQITSILKSCLGPKSYQKMLLTKINTIEITNDGNSILRELDTSHCATKMLVDLSRTQEIVGDGTTSVAILCGELLRNILPFLNDFHPSLIASELQKQQKTVINLIEQNCFTVDEKNFIDVVDYCLNTKLCNIFQIDLAAMAVQVCEILAGKSVENAPFDIDAPLLQSPRAKKTIDLKKPTNKGNLKSLIFDSSLCRIEKLPGEISQSKLVRGCVINKSLFHAQMRTEIMNPRIVLLQTGLEFKRNESQTHFQFTNTAQFSEALQKEEESITKEVLRIVELKPDIVCCEKGIGEYALGLFQSHNVTAFRRFKKTDMNRLAQVTGATIVHSAEFLDEKNVGKKCVQFKYVKIGEENFSCFYGPNVCTVLLRGPKNYLRELDRNFHDAFGVAKALFNDSRVVVGGGSIEYFVSESVTSLNSSNSAPKPSETQAENYESFTKMDQKSIVGGGTKKKCGQFIYSPQQTQWFAKKINRESLSQKIAQAISETYKTIPVLLSNNAGTSHLKAIGNLFEFFSEYSKRKKEFECKNKNRNTFNENFTYGVNGNTGSVEDMKKLILEPINVKIQATKSIFDMVAMLLRVDGVVHGTKNEK